MEAARAIYRKNAYEEPVEVRLMIYQEAIQMYDVHTSVYLSSLPFKQLSHFTQHDDSVTIHFKHSDDIKLVLEDDHPLLPEIRNAEKKKWLKPGGKVALLTLAVIAAVIFFNYIFSSLVADIGLKLITPQYEAELGDQMFQATVSPTALDGKRTAMVQSFANKLKLSDKYNIRVSVLKSDEINAFAVPGGHIVIYSGLIEKMQGYDELAALLGHEVTHINERHTTRSILKELSSKLFLIFFMDVSQVGAILLLNADKLRGLSYSRSLEIEADEKGLAILRRNNVDANGMVRLFERLKAADTLSIPSLLNTHPLTDKRIRYTKENIQSNRQTRLVIDPVLLQLWMNIKTNKFPGEDLMEE
jgi:beta-barrel assembly-enhancing protease